MASISVEIDEFRENLSAYLLQGDTQVAITRDGKTLGYFLPVPRQRTEEERKAFKDAADRLDAVLAAEGLTEDELVADFKRWRAAKHE